MTTKPPTTFAAPEPLLNPPAVALSVTDPCLIPLSEGKVVGVVAWEPMKTLDGVMVAIVLSLLQPPREAALTVDLKNIDYSTSAAFNIAALLVTVILIALYATWW